MLGKKQTFKNEEDRLRSRSVNVEARYEASSMALKQDVIAGEPQLWIEDIGKP